MTAARHYPGVAFIVCPSNPGGTPMDFDTLLHELADSHSWNLLYMKDDDTYKLTLSIPGDRFQDVFVTFRKDDENSHVAAIWSVIAKVHDFNLTRPIELLRFNWRNVYGSLAIKDDEVVVVQNQLASEANWHEVGKAVHYIGNRADEIEKSIYGDLDSH